VECRRAAINSKKVSLFDSNKSKVVFQFQKEPKVTIDSGGFWFYWDINYLLIGKQMKILAKALINIFCVLMLSFMMFFENPEHPLLFPAAVAYGVFLIAPGIIISNILLNNSIVFLIVSIFLYTPVSFHKFIAMFFYQLLGPNGYPRFDVLTSIFLYMAYSSLISILAFFIESKLLQENTPQRRRKIVNPRFRN
jgi:hypothetical protein